MEGKSASAMEELPMLADGALLANSRLIGLISKFFRVAPVRVFSYHRSL